MPEQLTCPTCGKPPWEDATEDERMADPPRICSPLRCTAWKKVGVLRKGGKDLRLIEGGKA